MLDTKPESAPRTQQNEQIHFYFALTCIFRYSLSRLFLAIESNAFRTIIFGNYLMKSTDDIVWITKAKFFYGNMFDISK